MKKQLSASKRGVKYEKRQATKLKGTHVGGPGNPDIIKGKERIEVKNRKDKLNSTDVIKAIEKKITTIISKSELTKPAAALAKRTKIKVMKGV